MIAFVQREFAPTGVTVTEAAMVHDPVTNVDREVDILISGDFNGQQITVGIECRDRYRLDDVMWIDQMIGKYQHLPIHKKVAVSARGFSRAAAAKATQFNIETLSLHDALRAEGISRFDRVRDWTMEGRRLIFHGVGFEFDGKSPPDGFDGSSRLWSSDGRRLGTAQSFVDWIYSTPAFIETVVRVEIAKHETALTFGLNAGRIQLALTPTYAFRSDDGQMHRVARVVVDVEYRLERLKPDFQETIVHGRYLAIAKARFSDVDLSTTTARVVSEACREAKWFFEHSQPAVRGRSGKTRRLTAAAPDGRLKSDGRG